MKRKSAIERLLIFVALILVVLISGCATSGMRMYTGEALPKEEVAVIMGSTKFLYIIFGFVETGVRIQKVDGEPILHPAKKCEVLPGLHEVVFIAYSEDYPYGSGSRATYSVKFNAEAGHQYKIKVPFLRLKGRLVKIIDTKSGEIVATQPID